MLGLECWVGEFVLHESEEKKKRREKKEEFMNKKVNESVNELNGVEQPEWRQTTGEPRGQGERTLMHSCSFVGCKQMIG